MISSLADAVPVEVRKNTLFKEITEILSITGKEEAMGTMAMMRVL